MKAEIFTIKYADRHAAALVYQKISQHQDDIGIIACGLERSHARSRRIRSYLKLNIVLETDRAKDLPSILKSIHASLTSHPIYPYLSFDYIAVPTSQTEWNFHSYDDPNWQKIFIQKRTRG